MREPHPVDERELPEGYRWTELGALPQEWEVVQLGEIAAIGKNRKGHHIDNNVTSIPFIPMSLIPQNALYISSWESREKSDIRSGTPVYNGDLLLAKITPSFENGKQGIVTGLPNGWGYATTEIIPLRPTAMLHNEFLAYHLMQSAVRKNLSSHMEGSTGRQRIPKRVLQDLSLPLPPLPEQRAIAHVLRTVQRARETTEQVIAALHELKKSLMEHLFSYGPVPVEEAHRVEIRESPIGPIPAHWRVVRLGEMFDIQQGKALSRKKNTGIRPRPFLRTSNVLWGKINLHKLDYMDFSEEEEEKLSLQAGDLLVCEGGDVGRTAMWEEQMNNVYYQNHLHRLRRTHKQVEPRFYMYWMQTAFTLFKLYQGSSNKTTIPNLSRSRLGAFAIPFPPLPEQEKIARILQAVDGKIEAEEQRKEALETLFQTLLHELMSARRRLPAEFVARFAESREESL